MDGILQNLHSFDPVFGVISYIIGVLGLLCVIYAFSVLCIISVAILRLKTNNPFKVIHIVSVIEVYIFICFLLGISLILKIHDILLIKLILFGIIVVFNGITATRLIAKTAYFYGMRQKQK